MSTPNTPKRGDLVYFNYGCGCGEDYGTVLGEETTAWGTHYWVRKSDFSLTTMGSVRGTVSAKFYTDFQGDTYLSPRGATIIGAYLVSEIQA